MAEFSYVVRNFNRMCSFYDNPPCKGCPMGICGINTDICKSRLFDSPETYENRIIKWAKEHPNVYPSWYDYLGFAGENRDHIMKIIKGPIPE